MKVSGYLDGHLLQQLESQGRSSRVSCTKRTLLARRKQLITCCSGRLLLFQRRICLVLFDHRERSLRQVLGQRVSSVGGSIRDLLIEMSVPTDSQDRRELVAVRYASRYNGVQAERNGDDGARYGQDVCDPKSARGVHVYVVVRLDLDLGLR
jgi:hypothetical protein